MTNPDLAAVLNRQDLGHLDALIPALESYIARHGKPESEDPSVIACTRSREARNLLYCARYLNRDDPIAVGRAVRAISNLITRWNLHLIACEAGKLRAARSC